MKIINPATEEIIDDIAEDDAESVRRKFAALKSGQPAWGRADVSSRIACIGKFIALLQSEREGLARALSLEVGKPLRESLNEIAGAGARAKFFVENSQKWLAPQRVNTDGNTAEEIAFEPLGVIASISAWNYPYLVAMNVIIPALIGGNAVIYKPSEYSTKSGLNIQRLLYAAGVPENVFQIVVGAADAGKFICELPLDGFYFTGSVKTGRAIAAAVAGRLIPLGLELGGKDPLYVTDDVKDVSATAAAAVEGSFYNTGQSCCAVERIYVHVKIYDDFVQAFTSEVRKLKVGDPFDEGTTLGPLTRQSQVGFLEGQVKDALAKGARLVTGGKRLARKGFFFEPTVLADVDHGMHVMRDESFGPIIGIQKVKDDAEAIRLMNDTEYGLTAAVYGNDEARVKKILAEVDAGTCYLNCCDRVSPYLPWSGRKNSGLGSTLSYLGILAFVRPKAWHLRKL